MPDSREFRLAHKRRQRLRGQIRKQTALDGLLDKIPPLQDSPLHPSVDAESDPESLADLYRPIPVLSSQESGEGNGDFWSRVPTVCNPREAVLNLDIADAKRLEVEKFRQRKYERKLKEKLERKEITEEEQKILWEKHGRSFSGTGTGAADGTADPQNEEGVSLLSADRGQRKAWQIENFVQLLSDKLRDNDNGKNLTVVDFGCGSGNLCLALAAYFVNVRFVLVDMKPYPLKLAQRRADEAGLTNIQVLQYTFSPGNLQDFHIPSNDLKDCSSDPTNNPGTPSHSFDIGIGLHCCGSFTDMVMEISRDAGADCIVCPCCNGAMTCKTTLGYHYPRSNYLRPFLTQEEYLGQLSRSADDLGNYSAKCLIEYDRALWAKENGFREVELWKLTPVECTPKHHVLHLKM